MSTAGRPASCRARPSCACGSCQTRRRWRRFTGRASTAVCARSSDACPPEGRSGPCPSAAVGTHVAMLCELRVENLLLIERAELRLAPGLNVLTGETGAGKTVLAHALDLLLGGKARQGIVRPGADEAYVEGVFDVPEGLLDAPELAELADRLPDEPDEIVLGRRVSASGRTSAFIGGRAASAADLRLL